MLLFNSNKLPFFCFFLSSLALATNAAVLSTSVQPRFTATTLKLTEKRTGYAATIPIKSSYGFEFDWKLATDRVQWYLFADLDFVTLSTLSNKTILDPSQTLIKGGMGLGIFPFSSRNVLISLVHSYQSQLFFRGISAYDLAVDKVILPGFELRLSAYLYRGNQINVSIEGVAISYFSVGSIGQNFRNGWATGGKALLSYDLAGSTQILGGPGFTYYSLQTELVDQIRTDFYGMVGLNWFLD